MKTTLGLLMALGLASQPVFAQSQAPEPQQNGGRVNASDITGPASPSTSATSSGSSSDLSSGASGPMRSEAGADLQDTSPTAGLKPVTHDDVTYLCGGVGEEEAAYMKKEAKGYDLMLTFAARDGAYLADVDVDIKDAKGNSVLQAACDGPILLVDLPRSGTYRVRAETAGYQLNKTVRVATSAKKRPHVAAAVLSWPQSVAEAGTAATTSTGSSGTSPGSAGSGSDRNKR